MSTTHSQHTSTFHQSNEIEQALLTLLQLQQKAREAESLNQLHFVVLNQTKILLDYEQAVLWDAKRQVVCGASAVTTVDPKAPFSQWIAKLSQQVARQEQGKQIHKVELDTLSAEADGLNPEASNTDSLNREAFTQVAVWVPLLNSHHELVAAVWLFRSTALSLREKRLLTFWSEQVGFVWQALAQQSRTRAWFEGRSLRSKMVNHKKLWCLVAVLAVGALFVPVRQSVLAPAEVVSATPMTVRMPLDGVVKKLWVKPNSAVKKGDLLLELDSQTLDDQLAQAQQQLSIASAELRVAQQQSFYDASRKASLAILEGKQALAHSQVVYLQEKVAQTRLVAQQDGIALFDDQGDWVGRPIRLGEPLMDIADPTHTVIKIQLAVEDRMALSQGDEVRFFLNSRPTDAIPAKLSNVAYRSTLQDDGQYAFELKAQMDAEQDSPTMGLKGMAKIYGERTSLMYYLLRRPLSHLRMWWGGL
ncbi:HlyD family secretion protein [Vibrio sp. ABG19]|uniref:HlyD family efflux transporter periplasmic adaptor subunit n=1 Tax=Vibrio sp. ABG19 TaxID=2817385 RepID=UPI00249EFFF0|nr:HlyD family secretion protein [Vibrio sp. ABG19]WGY46413.1 biotin/lipoyl-binding protein [Vibrio sp. ABG19]